MRAKMEVAMRIGGNGDRTATAALNHRLSKKRAVKWTPDSAQPYAAGVLLTIP
jgi:hypothetical protein